jgi:ABC-type Mn2+/Zn2+ transport system permease subunit
MRNTIERAAAIEKRTRELKRERESRREIFLVALSAAACLAVVILASLRMPGIAAAQSTLPGANAGAAAGVFAESSAAGYVLIGILAFALGCCVTILCFRLKKRRREDSDDRNS